MCKFIRQSSLVEFGDKKSIVDILGFFSPKNDTDQPFLTLFYFPFFFVFFLCPRVNKKMHKTIDVVT